MGIDMTIGIHGDSEENKDKKCNIYDGMWIRIPSGYYPAKITFLNDGVRQIVIDDSNNPSRIISLDDLMVEEVKKACLIEDLDEIAQLEKNLQEILK